MKMSINSKTKNSIQGERTRISVHLKKQKITDKFSALQKLVKEESIIKKLCNLFYIIRTKFFILFRY